MQECKNYLTALKIKIDYRKHEFALPNILYLTIIIPNSFQRKRGFFIVRARELYKQWEKQNVQFFQFGNIKEDQYLIAQQSLLNHWRKNNVTIDEIEMIVPYVDSRNGIANNISSALLGWSIGFIDLTKPTITSWLTFLALPLSIFMPFFVSKYAYHKSKKTVFYQTAFCRNTSLKYIELYKDDLSVKNKLVELRGGTLIEVPMNAEYIYGEKMRTSKYYRNAFRVVIVDEGQTFQYVWYSNKNYNLMSRGSREDFVRLCKDQIGMNWNNIAVVKISFEKFHAQKT